MIQPIIIAGGTGSRLWPISRESYPKQFQKLYGDVSMLQATIQRLQGLDCFPPLVICNEEHRFIVAEQLRQIDQLAHNIILEPIGRNTAPAIAIAAFIATRQQQDAHFLILAADHVIMDVNAFQESIRQAIPYVETNKLVTFGVVPKTPETGYGYIQCGEKLEKAGFSVKQFVEKPNLETAQRYLETGNYLWNSGMFAFKARVYLEELKKYRPDIYENCANSTAHLEQDLDFIRIKVDIFRNCPEDSIDYAVMEKTTDAVVVPMDAGWNDVGAWASLWDVSSKDEQGNVKQGDVLCINSCNNYLFSEMGLVAAVGIENTVVVQTKDAVLVTTKEYSQDVKLIVKQLQADKRKETKQHREVFRRWGKQDAVDVGERYQVKRITVRPNERLSMQMHYHRSEHWIVVAGTAKVNINGIESLLTENQSIYIPIGVSHFLENPGRVDLELIEVQVGSYLKDDDIMRFD
ncbi:MULTISPECIES: mannose-1-phosphate guanylyltransferase/mannose-6-phosphate isomerase [Glaesserella]|uniref:mannose-1-phosphate guanylyltransferase/mannose-6-phosphate isomerase n=1 Tax=Glaesserella TaxID=2094023 RepID=UPI002482CE6C|nr:MULTISPECIES: mannose-1-phosphate guanylyltransferase/mannose-6-phosphate isomerase [Glaesserella]